MLERLLKMLGFHTKPTPNYVGPDISRAIQRNEDANTKARIELEKLKMSDTVKDIVGKMK